MIACKIALFRQFLDMTRRGRNIAPLVENNKFLDACMLTMLGKFTANATVLQDLWFVANSKQNKSVIFELNYH